MTPLLHDLPPDERERLTSVVWAAQDPKSPTCDYCGRERRFILETHGGFYRRKLGREQCYCEARRQASRPQGEEDA